MRRGPGLAQRSVRSGNNPRSILSTRAAFPKTPRNGQRTSSGPLTLTLQPQLQVQFFSAIRARSSRCRKETKEFDLATLVDLTFGQEINIGGLGQQSVDQYTIGQSIGLQVEPPVFSITPSELTIAPGDPGKLQLTAYNPASTNGVSWVVTNIPTWLTVSQMTGSVSTPVTLSVSPDATPGTVASLNFNTDPAFGAPSVGPGPLIVTVTVGSTGPPCEPPLCTSQTK